MVPSTVLCAEEIKINKTEAFLAILMNQVDMGPSTH